MRDRVFGLFIAGVFASLVLAHLVPALGNLYQHGERFVFCPFKRLTGRPCPGCGMTRAFWALSGGHLREALRLNPFSVVLLGLALLELAPGRRRPEGLYRWLLPLVLIWWGVRLL